MSRALLLLSLTLAWSTLAGAQTMQAVRPISVQPIQSAPQVQPIPAITPVQADDAAEANPTDAMQPIETMESVKAANLKLRKANQVLRVENASLKEQLAAFTTRGGSQVRAFCPTDSTSRNTAGAEANCAASGYKCEDVSGLCHNTCSNSDMCATGYTCNPCNNKCEYTAGGAQPTEC